jgi:hypothetical protein
MASRKITGTFAGTGAGTSLAFRDSFNFTVYGVFVGTVVLEKSYDNGGTWSAVSKDVTGAAASFTAPASVVVSEPEIGILYRANCTAFTSGTINYRLSQ